MHLVLVEGFAGTGKTTTAEWLARSMKRRQHAVETLLETSPAHPILSFSPSSPEKFVRSFCERWIVFLETSESAGCANLIVEAAAFQHPINHLLCEDAPDELVRSCIERLSELLSSTVSALVYLHQEPPALHFERTVSERSDEWFDKAVRPIADTAFGRARGGSLSSVVESFVAEQRRLADAAFESWAHPKLRIDVSARQWSRHRREIAEFLGGMPSPEASGQRP